jgi:CBS domain-containing protein/gamma-glutamyl:cysteine ligase YbdK (ATP-grasp superfamily)
VGDLLVRQPADERDVQAFTKAVLRDIAALERLIESKALETGVRRIGIEQEMYLVGDDCGPCPCAPELLETLSDPRFTTELARFNLEANFPPYRLEHDVFGRLETEIREAIQTASAAAERLGGRVLLTGILPTLGSGDLKAENLTPELRYKVLNDALVKLHGAFSITIDGIEHYEGTHDSVVLEAANTSLQLHLQVDPDTSGQVYNLVQLISAPLLAAAANSPVLLGRRLWHETRIAVFERALDSRTDSQVARGSLSRVTFGDAWLRESVVEVFRDNIARFPVLLTRDLDGDSLEQVERGETPRLGALALHNGTVWRWNRPCYGVTDGRPHVRIECRILPGGPSVLDEVANAAFFYGMVLGLSDSCGDLPHRLTFAEARTNFLAAARDGLDAELDWLDGRRMPVRDLILDELLPAAWRGLEQVGIPADHVTRYLGTIDGRVRAGRTGSAWLLETFDANRGRQPQAVWRGAVRATLARQFGDQPVHEWPTSLDLAPSPRTEPTVGQIMTTNVFTVRPDDVLDLASSVMEWKHIRHVPVEGEGGALVGILTARDLLRARGRQTNADTSEPVPVRSVMRSELIRVHPDVRLIEAMARIVDSETGCLLVVDHTHQDRLLGVVTDRDLVVAARSLLDPDYGDPSGR